MHVICNVRESASSHYVSQPALFRGKWIDIASNMLYYFMIFASGDICKLNISWCSAIPTIAEHRYH